jgi:hypothetical protein
MPLLQLPHWLMIAGALLVVAGFIGLLGSRRNRGEVDRPSDEPTDPPSSPVIESKSEKSQLARRPGDNPSPQPHKRGDRSLRRRASARGDVDQKPRDDREDG